MQTKGEYTPGPWLLMNRTIYALDETGTTNRFSASVSAGWLVNNREPPSPAEMDANARLIAAAPELLGALDGLVRYAEAVRLQHGIGKNQQARLDAAKTALARAKGLPS